LDEKVGFDDVSILDLSTMTWSKVELKPQGTVAIQRESHSGKLMVLFYYQSFSNFLFFSYISNLSGRLNWKYFWKVIILSWLEHGR
jgi:hypothetical protein